jgi:hypothetical protein
MYLFRSGDHPKKYRIKKKFIVLPVIMIIRNILVS